MLPGSREAFGVRAVDRRFWFGRPKGIRFFWFKEFGDSLAAKYS
jgi:hypothetical protein